MISTVITSYLLWTCKTHNISPRTALSRASTHLLCCLPSSHRTTYSTNYSSQTSTLTSFTSSQRTLRNRDGVIELQSPKPVYHPHSNSHSHSLSHPKLKLGLGLNSFEDVVDLEKGFASKQNLNNGGRKPREKVVFGTETRIEAGGSVNGGGSGSGMKSGFEMDSPVEGRGRGGKGWKFWKG